MQLHRSGHFGRPSDNEIGPAMSEELKCAILMALERLEDFQAQEAAEAVPAVIATIGETPSSN